MISPSSPIPFPVCRKRVLCIESLKDKRGPSKPRGGKGEAGHPCWRREEAGGVNRREVEVPGTEKVVRSQSLVEKRLVSPLFGSSLGISESM